MENQFQVAKQPSATDKITDMLGISKKREAELDKTLDNVFKGNTCAVTILSEMSKHCTSANELAYCCFNVGTVVAKLEGSPLDAFFGMLSKTQLD